MQFIGENSISHVAKGEEMRLNLGSFFNVFVSGKIARISKLSENKTQEEGEACATLTARYAYDAEVTFNNADLHAQEVVFEQNLGGEAEVENESLKGSLKDAGTYVWKVTVFFIGKTAGRAGGVLLCAFRRIICRVSSAKSETDCPDRQADCGRQRQNRACGKISGRRDFAR